MYRYIENDKVVGYLSAEWLVSPKTERPTWMAAIAALEPAKSGKTKTQTEGQLWLRGPWRRTAGPDFHR